MRCPQLTAYIVNKIVKNSLEIEFLAKILNNITVFQNNQLQLEQDQSFFKQLKLEFYPKNSPIISIGNQLVHNTKSEYSKNASLIIWCLIGIYFYEVIFKDGTQFLPNARVKSVW